MYKLNLQNLRKKSLNLVNINKFKFSTKTNKNEKKQKDKEIRSSPETEQISNLPDYSNGVMKLIIKDQENMNINNHTFQMKDSPKPNHFGERVLYYSYNKLPQQYEKSFIEISGPVTLTSITFLNYYGLIFPSAHLFNYLAVLTISSYFKFIWKILFKKTIIYQMTLLDENNVKITYIGGTEEKVPIQNIYFTSKMRNKLALNDEAVSKKQKSIFSPIEMRINGKIDAFILLSSDPKLQCYVDFFNILGILNKKTKNVSF